MRGFGKSIVVFVAGLASATPAASETLADALVGAYNHSGLLEQNRAVLRAADEDVAVAISALRPVVTWSAGVARSYQRSRSAVPLSQIVSANATTASVEVSASLTIYDYGRNKMAVDVAKEAVLAARQALVSVEQQVLISAVSAFLEMRRAMETVALRENNVRLITQELRAANDRFDVGEVTRTDVALAEARLAAARSGLASAQGNLAIAVETYRAEVGRKPGALVQPGALPSIPGSVDKAKGLALKYHPDMLRAKIEVTIAELNVLRARAAMKPTVTLTGRLAANDDLTNRGFSTTGSVSLGASGTLYAGGRLSALLRQSMASRDAAIANLHVISHAIEQNVGNAYARLGVARASREASTRQVAASRVAFRGVREEATLGARTTLDVLDAEQELLDAQAQSISARVDEQVAVYTVLGTMGYLTAKRLKLGVQEFDPEGYYNMVHKAPTRNSKQGKELDRVLRALGKQ